MKTPLTCNLQRGKTFRNGPGATRTRDLLLRSRPTPATVSARWRKSLKNHRPVASRRQPAPGGAGNLISEALTLRGAGRR